MKSKAVIRAQPHAVSTKKTIELSTGEVLDVSELTDAQIQVLQEKHAEIAIELAKNRKQLQDDVGALRVTLQTLTDETARASEVGAHATLTHTVSSAAGRTEVVVGNTDRAAAGKISRSAAGQRDIQLWIIGILAAAAIIIAMVVT